MFVIAQPGIQRESPVFSCYLHGMANLSRKFLHISLKCKTFGH
jgi:hypothetical protein